VRTHTPSKKDLELIFPDWVRDQLMLNLSRGLREFGGLKSRFETWDRVSLVYILRREPAVVMIVPNEAKVKLEFRFGKLGNAF
jgi:hypothetical protein